MNDQVNYKNNPLHGLSLKNMLVELVDHYGFDILFAYLSINCFKTNPSIESSVKFLKKMTWAREKVEAFYMYQYKNLPRASAEQFELPPRDRIVPDGQVEREPAVLSLEDAQRLLAKRAKKSAERSSNHKAETNGARKNGSYRGNNTNRHSHNSSRREELSNDENRTEDPWANWRNKAKR